MLSDTTDLVVWELHENGSKLVRSRSLRMGEFLQQLSESILYLYMKFELASGQHNVIRGGCKTFLRFHFGI